MTNRHGLSRNIDAETKRQIRINSGFSCVICRAPFCTYEHFDPEYKDAKEHNPDGMCLLCSTCQADTTAGRLSKKVIADRYRDRRNEDHVESTRDNVLFFDRMPLVKVGKSTVRQADTIICTDEIDCLSFSIDRETGTFLINMAIFDEEGQCILKITNNTWSSEYAPWDFECSGKVVTFRSAPGKILFRAILDGENNRVEITHLNMTLNMSNVRIENDDIIATRISKDGTRAVEIGVQFFDLAGKCAVFLDNREDIPHLISHLPILHSSFGGITIGRSSSLCLAKFFVRTNGVDHISAGKKPSKSRLTQAYVLGRSDIKTITFPFWSEKEYYLNTVKLEQPPISVDDDYEDPNSGTKGELFLIGGQDAWKFTKKNGLIAHAESDLPRPPKRPHRFL